MKEQELKKLIERAIDKGWVFYGEFSTDVATESVLKLLKEQLTIPVVVLQSEHFSLADVYKIAQNYTEEQFIEMIKHVQG